jgi:hypothetical protein
MSVTALDATLTKLASVSALDATLTRPSRKCIKTRDFNPIRCHTYEVPSRKPCRINTYKKQGGGGMPAFDSQLSTANYGPHRTHRSPVTNHQSPVTSHRARLASHYGTFFPPANRGYAMTPFARITCIVLDKTLGNKPASGTEILIYGEVRSLG